MGDIHHLHRGGLASARTRGEGSPPSPSRAFADDIERRLREQIDAMPDLRETRHWDVDDLDADYRLLGWGAAAAYALVIVLRVLA